MARIRRSDKIWLCCVPALLFSVLVLSGERECVSLWNQAELFAVNEAIKDNNLLWTFLRNIKESVAPHVAIIVS